MKIVIAMFALGLMATGAASAAAVTAASDAECSDNINSVKAIIGCGVYYVKCIGDGVAGNPCHPWAAAAATPDVKEVVDCTKQAVKNHLQGTPQPCAIEWEAAGPDVKEAVECTKSQVKQIAQGVTPMPCAV